MLMTVTLPLDRVAAPEARSAAVLFRPFHGRATTAARPDGGRDSRGAPLSQILMVFGNDGGQGSRLAVAVCASEKVIQILGDVEPAWPH